MKRSKNELVAVELPTETLEVTDIVELDESVCATLVDGVPEKKSKIVKNVLIGAGIVAGVALVATGAVLCAKHFACDEDDFGYDEDEEFTVPAVEDDNEEI